MNINEPAATLEELLEYLKIDIDEMSIREYEIATALWKHFNYGLL